MRNERGTLRIKTEDKKPRTERALLQFPLGPFVVQCTPNAYQMYTRYTIMANGVPIRDQITYPEVEDGWQGLTFTRTIRKDELTEEQKNALAEFHNQQHRRRTV